MAKNEFEMNLNEIENLEDFFKRNGKLFVRAAVGTVNNIAFEQRKNYIEQIEENMTVRNEKFVSRQMRVTTAKARNLDNIQALAGSIKSDRFSGWEEQETGKPSANHRTFTAFGRVSVSMDRQAKGKARAKTNNTFAKISDYTIRATSRRHRLIIFLQMMTERKKAFVMPRKYKGLKRGVYFVKGKQLKRVQTFGQRKVKREPWMKPVNDRLKQQDISKQWKKTLNYLLPRKL